MIGDDQEFPISQDIFEFESPSIQCKFQNLLSTNLPIGCQGNQSVAPYVSKKTRKSVTRKFTLFNKKIYLI